MSKPLVPDDLWEAIAPLLPEERPKPKGGRPRCDDRLALAGIIFVLRSGIPWEMLPREFGCSGMTCWRRLRDWQTAGVWTTLHRVLLERLSNAGHLDWSRASLDSAAVAAKKGGPRPARTRRIAENRARSAILWSTARAPRSGCA
jgi:transposase